MRSEEGGGFRKEGDGGEGKKKGKKDAQKVLRIGARLSDKHIHDACCLLPSLLPGLCHLARGPVFCQAAEVARHPDIGKCRLPSDQRCWCAVAGEACSCCKQSFRKAQMSTKPDVHKIEVRTPPPRKCQS